MIDSGSEQVDVFDYLRSDAFMQDMVSARALHTAFQLGLIDFVHQRESTLIGDLKSELGCDSQGLLLLLDILTASRVIDVCDANVRLSPEFASILPYSDLLRVKLEFANFVSPDFSDLFTLLIKDPARFGSHARIFDLFDYQRCFDYSPENYARTRRWVRITTCLTKYEAQVAIKYHDFGAFRRLLDIGGNSGEFALRICKRFPAVCATIFDLPLVCEIGREHVRLEPEAERITFVPGDAFADDWPKGFDLITFKSILHDWPERQAQKLIQKAEQSLLPGGTLLIFERGPIEIGNNRVPYSMLPFLLFFRSFRSPHVYSQFLQALDFQNIDVQTVQLEMPFSLVTATKRA